MLDDARARGTVPFWAAVGAVLGGVFGPPLMHGAGFASDLAGWRLLGAAVGAAALAYLGVRLSRGR